MFPVATKSLIASTISLNYAPFTILQSMKKSTADLKFVDLQVFHLTFTRSSFSAFYCLVSTHPQERKIVRTSFKVSKLVTPSRFCQNKRGMPWSSRLGAKYSWKKVRNYNIVNLCYLSPAMIRLNFKCFQEEHRLSIFYFFCHHFCEIAFARQWKIYNFMTR